MFSDKKHFRANKGQLFHLDDIYGWSGLIPTDAYENTTANGEPDDLGDHVVFTKTVSINAQISVRD